MRGAQSRTRNSRGTHGGWMAKGRSARRRAQAAGGDGTGWRLLWWRLLRLSDCWLERARTGIEPAEYFKHGIGSTMKVQLPSRILPRAHMRKALAGADRAGDSVRRRAH